MVYDMAEKMTNKADVIAKAKADAAAKTATRKLSDDALENVNGGFVETDQHHWSHDWNIICPMCGETKVKKLKEYELFDDDTMGTTEYHCSSCNNDFVVDGETGLTMERSAWVNFLQKNFNYVYPFA